MTTAVAPAVATSVSLGGPSMVEQASSSRVYNSMAGPSGLTSTSPASKTSKHSPPSLSEARLRRTSSDDKHSPISSRTPQIPKVVVKQEPSSPEIPQAARHRPRKLDLSNHNMAPAGAMSGRPSAPLTSKDSAGLALHDVGLACLSPGFNTQDPTMQQQLQRSMSVRDQQRLIIEARQKSGKAIDGEKTGEGSLFRPTKTPGTSRRKGPPPALSIAPPSHEQFANERVIQSAPLGHTFTGLRQNPAAPITRQVVNQPSSLSHTSHIHHVPANQTNNRLPPISDVFPGELQPGATSSRAAQFNHSPGNSSHSNNQPPLPSPGYPPQFQQQQMLQAQQSKRPREYKSAEEAVQSMTGGREDLLPRIVHYGGHQPPTPPSPAPHKNVGLGVSSSEHHRSGASSSSGSRRRDREEYERDNGSPPLGRGPQHQHRKTGPFGAGRDSPESQARKREEFLQLCERAWDLFHS